MRRMRMHRWFSLSRFLNDNAKFFFLMISGVKCAIVKAYFVSVEEGMVIYPSVRRIPK